MPPEALPPPATSALPASVVEIPAVEARSDVLLTLFKWHRLILGCGLVLAVAAWVATSLRTPVHSAVTKVLIKSDQGTLTMSGLPAGARPATPELLQSKAEFFASPVVLGPVARALRAERGEAIDEGQLARDIRALRADLLVTPVPTTTILQATYSAADVREAERRLRMILDSFVEQHRVAFSGSASLSTFFERELGKAAAKLHDAEERLRRWQEANSVVAVDEQIAGQLSTLAELEGALRRTEADIEATRAHVATLERDIAALPVQLVTSREHVPNPLAERLRGEIATAEAALGDTSASPLVTRLQTDLVMAEIALADLRQRYTDQDRRVQEKVDQVRRIRDELTGAQDSARAIARARLDVLRQQLAAVEGTGEVPGKQTVAPNPLRETLRRELATTRARLTALESQREALRQQEQPVKVVLAQLREQRLHFDRGARDVEVARALYVENTKRLDDARIAAALERDQLTNVAIIEPPYGVETSRSLRSMAVVVLLAAVVGLGVGAACAFALEFSSWTMRTREEVEFYLGVPALAAVPALPARGRRPLALVGLDDQATRADDV